MALWSWRTLPDGSVEVDYGDGRGFVRPLSEPHPQVLSTQQRVLEWRELAAKYADQHGVPLSWVLAVVFAESGGKADADNAPGCGGTGCVGLMAIHWAVHGQSREAMLDPARNLDYGTSLLAGSRHRGYDLPATASIHVAGGGTEWKPHGGGCRSARVNPDFPQGSPWGYCEHMFTGRQGDGAVGYIERVVRANNSFLDLLGQRLERPPAPWQVVSRAEPRPLAPRLVAFAGAAAVGYLSLTQLSAWLRSRA